MKRLAVVTSHPIQYEAPLFRRLVERGIIDLRVFYGWEGGATEPVIDRDFGQAVQWDVPLLDGYGHEFLPNRSRDPGTHHFYGLDNPSLVARVLAFRPEAVLVSGWGYRSHLRLLRAVHGRVPVLFHGDSTLIGERPGPRRLARRAFLRWVYRHVDKALYVGTHNREYFEAHGLRDEHLAYAPHAVDDSRFEDVDGTSADEAHRWRAKLGVPDDATTFVFAGKLEPQKAPDVLLKAFLMLGPANAHLIFVGSGQLEGALRARAVAEGRRVHFVGFQNQSKMPVAYRLGDVLVLPSRGESWGLAVNEAMACGRPAIVTDRVGCAPDLVLEGMTGTVLPAGDPEPLSKVLGTFVARPDLASRMGQAAARHISGWSLDHRAEAIESAFEGVLALA